MRRVMACAAAVLLAGCGVGPVGSSATTGGSGAVPPEPTPTPRAADPVVTHACDQATRICVVTASNPSDVPCHRLALHVLSEVGYRAAPPDPQGELENGVKGGTEYDYADVPAHGQVTKTLPADAIVRSLAAGQSFYLGAVGYCMDGR